MQQAYALFVVVPWTYGRVWLARSVDIHDTANTAVTTRGGLALPLPVGQCASGSLSLLLVSSFFSILSVPLPANLITLVLCLRLPLSPSHDAPLFRTD